MAQVYKRVERKNCGKCHASMEIAVNYCPNCGNCMNKSAPVNPNPVRQETDWAGRSIAPPQADNANLAQHQQENDASFFIFIMWGLTVLEIFLATQGGKDGYTWALCLDALAIFIAFFLAISDNTTARANGLTKIGLEGIAFLVAFLNAAGAHRY